MTAYTTRAELIETDRLADLWAAYFAAMPEADFRKYRDAKAVLDTRSLREIAEKYPVPAELKG